MYKGVYAGVISTDKFDDDTDISTTYLGQVDMMRNTEVKAEENFPMTARDYTRGQLLDGYRLWCIDRHRCKQVIHVQIISSVMQVTGCNAKIHFYHKKNSSW